MLIITCIESSLLLFLIPACATCCVSLTLHHLSLGSPPPLLNEEACAVYVCLALVCVCAREEHVGASNCTVERASGHVRVSLGGGVKQHPSLPTFFALCVSPGCKIHVCCTHTRAHTCSNSRFQIYLYPRDHSEQHCCEIHTPYHRTSWW